MSEDKADLIRRGYEAWSRGDFAVLLEIVDADFRWEEPSDMVGASGGRGQEEFERHLRGLSEIWAELRWEPDEPKVIGDVVLVAVLARGRGKTSGAEVEQEFLHVWTVKDGRAVRMEGYLERREALERLVEAAGGGGAGTGNGGAPPHSRRRMQGFPPVRLSPDLGGPCL
jgi:uncharacterized protein